MPRPSFFYILAAFMVVFLSIDTGFIIVQANKVFCSCTKKSNSNMVVTNSTECKAGISKTECCTKAAKAWPSIKHCKYGAAAATPELGSGVGQTSSKCPYIHLQHDFRQPVCQHERGSDQHERGSDQQPNVHLLLCGRLHSVSAKIFFRSSWLYLCPIQPTGPPDLQGEYLCPSQPTSPTDLQGEYLCPIQPTGPPDLQGEYLWFSMQGQEQFL